MNKHFKMNLQFFAEETLSTPRDNLPNVTAGLTAREVDFVTRFDDNWTALNAILGVMRPIRKSPGTRLTAVKASVALANTQATPGAVIPYSKASFVPVAYDDLNLELYAAATTIQDVEKYGAAIAVEKLDDAFLVALQGKVLQKFYTFLATGTLTGAASSWKAAIAKAQGAVLNKFAAMQKNITGLVGFANILDAYDYLADAQITTQTAFGLQYVKDFMGMQNLILLPESMIPRGVVRVTPVDNIDLYYVDPSDGDFARMGLTYTVKGETNLIGFHAKGNYNTAVGETYAIMGMALWAEHLDGIASFDVGTESFTAVSNPTGNPAALGYYEKDANNNYFRTTDTTVASGKTYYTRTVTPIA